VHEYNLACLGDEKGLEFTVNPTYHWQCYPWWESKIPDFYKITINWLGDKEVQARIELNDKDLKKYNKSFVLKPGRNVIDFPILNNFNDSKLIIGDKSYKIEMFYLACPD
jgi:hypothetical protein